MPQTYKIKFTIYISF